MQTQRGPFGQFDIRRYVDIFWKRKFFVIVPAVLVIGATVFYVSSGCHLHTRLPL